MSRSLSSSDDHRLLSEEKVRTLYERVRSAQRGGGQLTFQFSAWWSGELRWARNRVSLASDRRDVYLRIFRRNYLGGGAVETNQIDDASLTVALRAAERKMLLGGAGSTQEYDNLRWTPPLLPFPDTRIWSDATYNVTPRQRAVLAQTLTEGAEAQQLLSAGFLQMRVRESFEVNAKDYDAIDMTSDLDRREGAGVHRTARVTGYQRHTEAQCSMTVRHPKGAGSGWAGLSSYAWSAIDAGVLAARALDKCVKSLNPVAIEPGRYTVILEPQAVMQLVGEFVDHLQSRGSHESPRRKGVFSLDIDRASGLRLTRLGQKVVDERISISHDPMHPQLGILPEPGLGPVTWIERGVLKTIGYDRGERADDYSLGLLNENLPVLRRGSFAMTGGTATLDEMIASTKRGIVVSRFSNIASVPNTGLSVLISGVTRDGLWLVENGKINKAIKNMRFTDSPLFVLNQIEMLGVPVPVFVPGRSRLNPIIVPAIKANDFAFTATVDAV